MKTLARCFILAICCTMLSQLSAKAQGTRISVEIDPATFVLNGYSAHLRLQPKNSSHLLFGVGTYAMDMPAVLVNVNEKNKDKGWQVRINQSWGLFAEHHFTKVNQKWFLGAQTSLQEYKIEKEQLNGNEKFKNLLLMGYGGYTWQPFKFNFYLKPWAGIGYISKINGNNQLGNDRYNIAPILPFATLHLGYTF